MIKKILQFQSIKQKYLLFQESFINIDKTIIDIIIFPQYLRQWSPSVIIKAWKQVVAEVSCVYSSSSLCLVVVFYELKMSPLRFFSSFEAPVETGEVIYQSCDQNFVNLYEKLQETLRKHLLKILNLKANLTWSLEPLKTLLLMTDSRNCKIDSWNRITNTLRYVSKIGQTFYFWLLCDIYRLYDEKPVFNTVWPIFYFRTLKKTSWFIQNSSKRTQQPSKPT